MAGFQLPFGVKPINAVPVDYYSGPYISNDLQDALDQAYIAIPLAIRFRTMEVRLIVNNFGLKYWFKDGTSNNDLIEFVTSPSSFYIQGGTTQSYNTISDIYRTGSLTIGTSSLNSSKLYVYSTQSGAFRLEDGSQGDNYILTTSGTFGVASWTSSTSTFYVQGGTTYSNNTTSNIYRTGSVNIGTGTATDGRFVVSSSTGSVSLVVDENGNIYNYNNSSNTNFGFNNLTNTLSTQNTTFGFNNLSNNTLGGDNTTIGYYCLHNNTIGSFNVAIGVSTLSNNLEGENNTGIGNSSLNSNLGSNNTAVGSNSLSKNIDGTDNIAIGLNAGTYFLTGVSKNTTYTNQSIFIGNNSRALGNTQSNQIVIGYEALGNGSDSVTLGNNNITKTILKGNVGIGLTGPSTKLHIYSTTSGAFRLEDGSQGDNYILTTSGTFGVASWTSSTSTFYVQGGTTYSSDTTSAIYRTGPLSIGTGTASNSRFVVSSSGGTVSLFVSENGAVSIGGTLSSYVSNSQQSTLFVKGTTSSIMKVVGIGATWSNSESVFLIEDSLKVSIGPTFSNTYNATLNVNIARTTGNFGFGVHTNGNYVTSKGGGKYAFADGSTGMHDAGANNIKFISYGTGDAFKFEPQYTTSNFSGVGLGNNIQRIILQEYPIAASFSNNQIRMIELSPTINKTGTASGIDRGLYINPTLTNDLNRFRSIEVTKGDVLFNTVGGNVGIGLTGPSTKLHIYSTTSGAFRLEDGTQSYPGYVLTSDANGVGTWQGNTQITLSGPTATALASWNNTTVMSNFSATCSITIPTTGLPPNFSFRFIVISGNNSSGISFTYSSPVSILPNTLLTFAQYESGVIDRFGTSSNYYITY